MHSLGILGHSRRIFESLSHIGSKIDAIPGRLNLTFTLRLFNRGMNRGFCYELCGQGHYGMQIISSILLFLSFSFSSRR